MMRSATGSWSIAGRLGMTYAAVKVRPILRLVHVESGPAREKKLISAARTLGGAAAGRQDCIDPPQLLRLGL